MRSKIEETCMIFLFCLAFLIGSISGSGRLRRQVIGGENANIKDFPYQASIRFQGKHFCGGIIIGEKHILTVAHCFTADGRRRVVAPYDGYSVHTGTSYSFKGTGYPHRFARLELHPGWIGTLQSSLINDIAVITLADSIVFDQRQKNVKLPSHNVVSGTKAYLSGWGKTSSGKDATFAEQLQKLEMTLLTNSECESKLPVKIYDTQLCAYHSRRYGSCVGDSGGPLVADNEVIGIISWMYEGNCGGIAPNIYTNVYAHQSFVLSAMSK